MIKALSFIPNIAKEKRRKEKRVLRVCVPGDALLEFGLPQ
jgi:hypothetical protein